MNKYIASYNAVTDWDFIPYQNTRGSRSKIIVVNPKQEECFFNTEF